MEKNYNFHYKGRIIRYSESSFRRIEAEFRKFGRAVYRIFCSRVEVKEEKAAKRDNLETAVCL